MNTGLAALTFVIVAALTWVLCELPAMGARGEFPGPALKPRVLVHEGGFTNHPRDPGGPTLQGITQRVYNHDRMVRGLSVRPLSAGLLRDNVWAGERDGIYNNNYWKPCRGDELPRGVGYSLFDLCVNSGPARGGKMLGLALGLPQTSVVTDEMVTQARKNPRAVCVSLNDARQRWLQTLSTYDVFGKGWSARVRSVKSFCLNDLASPTSDAIHGIISQPTSKSLGERLSERVRKITAAFGPGKAMDLEDELEELIR